MNAGDRSSPGWLLLAILFAGVAQAQSPTLPLDRPGERALDVPEPGAPTESPPGLQAPLISPPAPKPSSGVLRVYVQRFAITGNTVFSDEALAEITEPYRGRVIDTDELESLRLALTQHYVAHGYINSGAVIPDQTVTDGAIAIRIIEGRLSFVDITGLRRLRTEYVRDRIVIGTKAPLKIQRLEERLFLLQQDPRIARIHAWLQPGRLPEEAELTVQVEEAQAYSLDAVVDNHRPPSVGAERGQLEFTHQNVSGWGDRFRARYGITSGFDDVDIGYEIPVSARDTVVELRYYRSDSKVIEEPFKALNVSSDSWSWSLGVLHPIRKTPRQEFALGLSIERRVSETFLLGEPFSFSPGVVNGRSEVAVVRFTQSWLQHDPDRVMAARSIFSRGIDAFDATVHNNGPDGRFFGWLGQFQWVQRYGRPSREILARADVQLVDQAVLALEQFAVGGAATVRGYRENQLVRDNGLSLSLEHRSPIRHGWGETLSLQWAAFVDYGRSWNKNRVTPSPRSLSSVGLGLRGRFGRRGSFALYWAGPLRDIQNPNNDLQDDGIHFQLRVPLF